MSDAIDLLLALGLVALAVEIAAGRSLFRAVVTFIVFGLVMSLAWARLDSGDLALAEAALGAGITGALLLVNYRRLSRLKAVRHPPGGRLSRLALPLGVLVAAMVALLGFASLAVPPGTGSAGALALEAMPRLPIDNPVTAVLLVFRGYDTLLETAVLLAAYLAARYVLGPTRSAAARAARSASAALPPVGALVGVVVPVSVLVSGHLLHAGGDAPGGAFQAGAVLAGAGVLLVLTGRAVALPEPPRWQRLLLVLGVGLFAGIGLWSLWGGAGVLALPGLWALYAIETALLLSIALALVLLFAAGGGLGARTP